ncbi:MAG: AraC family transcriptional regulator [Bacteroidales bacterium]|nr:AraC family transcriptional regulator [Bacteroidales bacterium]
MKIQLRFVISHLTIILLLLFPTITFSQGKLAQRRQDFYASAKLGKLFVQKLNLGAKSYSYNQDTLLKYYNLLLKEYQSQDDSLNKARNIIWLYEIGYIQASLNQIDLAIKTFEQALKLTSKQNNPRAYKYLKIELGDAYRMVGKKKKSNETFLELLDLPIMQKDTAERINCLRIMAENYEYLKEYQKAMELSLQLYNYALEKNDYNMASYKLIQMGRMAAFIESDTNYFEYFHLANSMARRSRIQRRIGNNLINTGNAYRDAGYPKKALSYLLDAYKYKDYFTTYGYVYNLLSLSSTYFELDSIPQSYAYAQKSMQISKKIDAYNYVYQSSIRLANCYIKMNVNDSAKIYLQNAIRLTKDMDNKNRLVNLYKQLSNVCIKIEDYAAAVAYLDSSYIKYTKLITETNDNKLAELRIESDYYIHRTRINELVSNNIIEKEKSKQLSITVISITIALVISIFSAIIIRKRLKQTQESYVNLVKKNIELDKLNHQLHECEIRPTRKAKHENIKNEDVIIQKLKKLLYTDEIFKNSNISLSSLAEELETNTSYLSAIVNNHFNSNLRSLLNKHRIDKARKMLVSEEFKHYSMEGIASEVGFKSRSGFYQTFKIITGLTPSLYIKNYRLIEQYSDDIEEAENGINI